MKFKILVLCLVLFIGACSSSPNHTKKYVVNQTYKSKIALRKEQINVRLLSVKADGNYINVSGFISSQKDKQKAENILKNIYPNKTIENFLIVK